MSFLLTNAIRRVVNLTITPFVARGAEYVSKAVDNIPPATRRKYIIWLTYGFYPIFIAVDGLRLALVRMYVVDAACFQALKQRLSAVSKLLYQGKVEDSPAWTPKSGTSVQTRPLWLPLLLLFTPVFFATDSSRTWLVDTIWPSQRAVAEQDVQDIWSYMFGNGQKLE